MFFELGFLQVVFEVDIDSMDIKCGGDFFFFQELDLIFFNSKTDIIVFSQDCFFVDGQEINKQCKVVRGGRRRLFVYLFVQRINYDAVFLIIVEVEVY